MKTLLPLILSIALAPLALYAQTPPPQAVAAGFNKLVFDDEFTVNDVTTVKGSTAIAGINWYPWNWAAATSAVVSTGTVNGATGVLTVTGGNVATLPTYAIAGNGSWTHGYFEVRAQFNPKVTSFGQPVWPGIWFFGTNWYATQPQNHPATLASEDDVFEAWPASASVWNAAQTLHNWSYPLNSWSKTDTANTDNNNQMMNGAPTDGAWHTYGMLWTATGTSTGAISFYFDNVLVQHNGSPVSVFPTGTGTGFTAQEIQPIVMILQGGPSQPLLVDWAHVFQTGPAAPQTAPMLVASLTQSLTPQITNQGQPITYTVVSGAATVSGYTLTSTATGTVVLNATAPATPGYAAYQSTSTITTP